MPIAIILLNLLPAILRGVPGVSAKLKQLISDVSGGAAAVLGSGAVTALSVNTALAAWAGVIRALQLDTTLPAASLNALLQLEKAVQAALTEDAVAAQAVDWTQVHPIMPV